TTATKPYDICWVGPLARRTESKGGPQRARLFLRTDMNRRDFLHPHHLAHSAGLALAGTQGATSLEMMQEEETALVHCSRRAMATQFEVLLPFGTPRAAEAAEAALDEIDRLEAQLTVYRDDSEVSRINREAFHGPVAVEASLFQLFEQAARLWRETSGAFDI